MKAIKAIMVLTIGVILAASLGCNERRSYIRIADDYYWDGGAGDYKYTEYRIGYGRNWPGGYYNDRRWDKNRWDNRHWNDRHGDVRRWDGNRSGSRHGGGHR